MAEVRVLDVPAHPSPTTPALTWSKKEKKQRTGKAMVEPSVGGKRSKSGCNPGQPELARALGPARGVGCSRQCFGLFSFYN